jgi:AcrR family transcriptional regulator
MARRRIDGSSLTRERIVAAAVRHAEAGRLSEVTIRVLAAELEVSPMALYRHVRDKDDLLLAVTDVMLVRHPVADKGSGDWRDHLRAVALSLRELLRREPALARLYGRTPVTTPAALERLSAAVAVLERSGFGHRDAVRAYAAVHTYTLGYCLLEIGRAASMTSPARQPPADARARETMSFVSEQQFRHGLAAIIEGLHHDNASRAAGRSRRPAGGRRG